MPHRAAATRQLYFPAVSGQYLLRRIRVVRNGMNAEARKRLLFVDDEPPVLALLQVLLRQVNPGWESAFVDRGAKALSLLARQTFDIVVSDMRMPEMTGAELLEQVRERHPRTARVILSGYADRQLSLRCLTSTHQYLAKPFTLAVLQSTLSRLFELDRLLPSAPLKDAVCRTHLLPSAPSLHARLLRELAAPGPTADALGGIIAQDVALTARGLQLVNSAFFGAAKEVLAAKDAAQSLGTGLVRTLALTDGVFWCPDPAQLPGFDLEAFCRHGVATGLRASRIVALEKGTPAEAKTAFTAGVLHDVGKLVLAVAAPELAQRVQRQGEANRVPPRQAEREVLEATHAEVGAYLLGLWGLPQAIVDVVAWHHQPRAKAAKGFGALAAVHVANALEHQSALPPDSPSDEDLDAEYLRKLGVERKLPLWARASASG